MQWRSRKICVRFFTLLCLLTLSVSCSSSEDGEESTNNAGADTSAPTVTDISPEDGASDVSVSNTISVTFSKSIEPVYAQLPQMKSAAVQCRYPRTASTVVSLLF